MKHECQAERHFFRTRGLILTPEDLTLSNWPERMHEMKLSTVALHPRPAEVIRFVQSDRGQEFLARCRCLGIEVEYALHAMDELVPRELFHRDPSLFRMDEAGERTPDGNLCVHSEQALEILAERVAALGQILRPTTSRHFFYGDDVKPWCRCPKCRGLSDSDQALIAEHRMLQVLVKHDPNAQVGHSAYHDTLWPPEQIRPEERVFLDYAPIRRNYEIPYAGQAGRSFRDPVDALHANLEVFARESAQVTEYWLDVSRFSSWTKPAVKLPWNSEVFTADLDTYGSCGIRHLTSFAVYVDAEYVAAHGEPPLREYGERLASWHPPGCRAVQ